MRVWCCSAFRRRGGFSLVEAAISAVLVGGVVVAAMTTLGSAVRARQVQAGRNAGALLAQRLMTEILQSSYAEPDWGQSVFDSPTAQIVADLPGEPDLGTFGPETGEDGGSRLHFDDVDDFDGWTSSPPQAKDGTPLANAEGWEREVVVVYVNPITLVATGRVLDSGLKRITVTVTDPDGEETRLVALRSNLSTREQTPRAETVCVNWVGVNVQVGTDSELAIEAGTNLLNQPVKID